MHLFVHFKNKFNKHVNLHTNVETTDFIAIQKTISDSK